jgi:hypothetical protein
MSTVREQIIAAVFTKLQTCSSATGGVFRSRVLALQRSETPSIAVEPISDNADPSMLGVIAWSMQLRIAVIARGSVPDSLADPVVLDVHNKMISDRRLGGLSIDIEPAGVKFELMEGDQAVGVISLIYQIEYRTKADDLTSVN